MELGQSVFRWGVFLPYRTFGVDSFHLRGGRSFWSFSFFWGCSRFVYSLYALWRLTFSNAYLVYLSKKKKKPLFWSHKKNQGPWRWDNWLNKIINLSTKLRCSSTWMSHLASQSIDILPSKILEVFVGEYMLP